MAVLAPEMTHSLAAGQAVSMKLRTGPASVALMLAIGLSDICGMCEVSDHCVAPSYSNGRRKVTKILLCLHVVEFLLGLCV